MIVERILGAVWPRAGELWSKFKIKPGRAGKKPGYSGLSVHQSIASADSAKKDVKAETTSHKQTNKLIFILT